MEIVFSIRGQTQQSKCRQGKEKYKFQVQSKEKDALKNRNASKCLQNCKYKEASYVIQISSLEESTITKGCTL